MGEGTRGLDAERSPRTTAELLGSEIAVVRDELDQLLAELDRRRHEALDVRLQLRRHAVGATLTTLAVVGTAAGIVGLRLWRQRGQDRLTGRGGRLRDAVSRVMDQPVAAGPTIVGKIAATAASAVAASLVKKLMERSLERFGRRGWWASPAPGEGTRFQKAA